ncbi:hypothetical protein EMQ25_03305 [Arsenicitalea aurantiaca]|uniref:Spy/CpxP family protein refolding chaperone n=1 Tax=Arsenicitalea aurantiaca TaxID=1783274 RepID=A0A433XLV4_9HYPH|nr:Spy/CpxP family protein refolding chaperone [Arsenicitalea aurantiaca]RUT34994.1 hypothetical protein EMQ25_03305 [Arsenicitalea aurantiaca]
MKSSKAVLSIMLASLCVGAFPALAQDAPAAPLPGAEPSARMAPAERQPGERFRMRMERGDAQRAMPGERRHHAERARPDRSGGHEMHRKMRERFAARMQERHPSGMPGRGAMRQGGALLDFVCSDRAAERLEIGLVRLSYRLDLTDAQRGDFDALRDAALSAQADFAAACTTARAAEATDPVSRLEGRLAIDSARVAALEAVLPALDTFYQGLEPEQQARLEPRRASRDRTPPAPEAPAAPGDEPAV